MTLSHKSTIRRELADERGEFCEYCGVPGSDLHHAIVPDKKSHKRLLFCKENLIILCGKCNVSKRFDNKAGRVYWWGVQCVRYGVDYMLEWRAMIRGHFVIDPFL